MSYTRFLGCQYCRWWECPANHLQIQRLIVSGRPLYRGPKGIGNGKLFYSNQTLSSELHVFANCSHNRACSSRFNAWLHSSFVAHNIILQLLQSSTLLIADFGKNQENNAYGLGISYYLNIQIESVLICVHQLINVPWSDS